MANVLDKYGIKEVCDITFYEISSAGKPSKPVLYIDTAKVSTMEQAAESVDATGGKGNVPLITWDYGRDITITLEDALFSAKSLGVMFGTNPAEVEGGEIVKVLPFTFTDADHIPATWEGPDGTIYGIDDSAKYYDATTGEKVQTANMTVGNPYFVKFNVPVEDVMVIDITSSRFPGTYYVTADTYARSEKTGNDEFFQLIIPKAKVLSEDVTLTMEAEGDPSTFQMNLKVLRNQEANQKGMVQLVKYNVGEGSGADYEPEIWSQVIDASL